MRRAAVTMLALLVGLPSVASAHITLLEPRPRTSSQKDGPCGAVGSVRGDRIAVFRPGETIAVSWDETIDHDSHYRIAFDVDGDDDFVPPAGRDDLYNSPAVLADGIGDEPGGGRYVQMVTLPNVECERCTLQLIQVMYGSGNYFQCADLALRADGTTPPPPPPDAGATSPPPRGDAGAVYADGGGAPRPGPGPDDPTSGSPPAPGVVTGGCAAGGSRVPTTAWWLAAGLLLAARRRRNIV